MFIDNMKMLILKLIPAFLIVCLFLYKQVKPYKHLLYPKYLKWYSFIEKIFDWVFAKVIRISPVKVGNGLSLDVAALLLLILLVSLLTL